MLRSFLLLVLFLGNYCRIEAQQLVSQPFVGHKSHTEFSFWCMFKKVDSVQFILKDDKGNSIQQKQVYFDKSNTYKKYFPINLNFNGLKANSTYSVFYTINNKQNLLFSVTTENDSLENFSFLAGSCAFVGTSFTKLVKPFNNLQIFNSMANDSANFMLWLGDNVYYIFEQNSPKKQQKRNTQVRLNKKLSNFFHTKEHYAIWDDHDFGSNNSGAEFKNKVSSLNVFQQFWPNPKNGDFNYYTFKKEDVQFFMLDGRYNKTEEEALGKQQFEWLKNELQKSDATFKIIAIGFQALNKSQSHESFYQKRSEFDALMNFIKEHEIDGIFFLTGDRHFAELVKVDSILPYSLYDFTTSTLSMYTLKKSATEELINPSVPNTYYPKNNYGKLSIFGTPENRQCLIELKNRQGEAVWQYSIKANELKFPK